MAGGGTDDDYWHNRAATVRANAWQTGAPVEAELDRLAAAERYERLYSAAARMLAAQGPARDDWPNERRQRWHELEVLLATEDPPGGAPDPARHLASRQDAAGRPVDVTDAVHDWAHRLDGDPDGAVVVLPGPLHLIVTELLDELAARLTPGRPIGAVGDGGADLSDLARDLADQLRPSTPADRPAVPAFGTPPLRSTGLELPAATERLAAAARRAAESVPEPATRDFSVRHDAAVAAADLLAGLAGTAVLGWRERHGDIRPDAHLVSGYRWDGAVGRPLGLAERAAEIRHMTRHLRPPWRPGPADPLPESTAQTSWIALPDRAALVTAELLDELSERLRPGRWIGTIQLAAFPVADFLASRLRQTSIAI